MFFDIYCLRQPPHQALEGRTTASWDVGRLGGILGESWDVLGGKTVLEPSWSRFGAVLEASWRRLGDVLGRLGSVLGASCGLFRGFLDRLGASGCVVEASCA